MMYICFMLNVLISYWMRLKYMLVVCFFFFIDDGVLKFVVIEFNGF